MKILSATISAFGTLREVRFSFGDGMSVMCRKNGFGKSTLIAYIKAMLYGFADTKKHSLADNDRKRYLPWGGGVYGGSLVIQTKDGCFRIERTFGERASDDTLVVYDAESGLKTEKLGRIPGHTLFGIDADGFVRTLCLTERIFSDGLSNESIADRLSRTVANGADLKGTDDAIALLQKQQKQLQKRGGRGEIAMLGEQISRQRARLFALEEAQGNVQKLRDEIEQKTLVLGQKQAARRALAEQGGQDSESRQTLTSAKARYGQLQAKLSETQRLLGASPLTHEEIDRIQRLEAKLDYLSQNSVSDSERLHELFHGKLDSETLSLQTRIYKNMDKEDHSEEIRAFWRDYPEFVGSSVPALEDIRIYQKRKKAFSLFPFFIFLFALGISLLCTAQYLSPITYAIGAALLLIPTIILCISPIPKQKKSISRRISRLISPLRTLSDKQILALFSQREHIVSLTLVQEENRRKEEELRQFLARFAIPSEDIGRGLDELSTLFGAYLHQCASEFHVKREQELCDRKEIDAFYLRYRAFGNPPYAALRRLLYERDALTRELDSLAQQIKSLGSEDRTVLTKSEETADSLDKEIRELELSLLRMKEKLAGLYEMLEPIEEERAVLQQLCSRRSEYERRLDILSRTEEYLRKAQKSMESTYLGATRESFGRILRLLSEEDGDVTLNQSLEIMRQERGLTHPFEAFSHGERDLYQLAMRLALIETLYGREDPPPILLDDPFLAFDDEGIKNGLMYLERLSQNTQIIYLTCSDART